MKNVNKISVLIGANGNGSFIAATSHEPYFCFEGQSEEEVVEKAKRALNFYGAVQARGIRQPVNAPRARTLRSFVPARKIDLSDLAIA